MSGWTAKRFWSESNVVETPDGFTVQLDGRDIRTPGKSLLVMPTRALAEAVREEWDAQSGKIDPETMPVTRTVNSAIDKVGPQRDNIAAMIAEYGDADLLCYRATSPKELVERQCAAWDPLLDWAADALGARLLPRPGVVHQPQDRAALDRLGALLKDFSDIELTAFHDLVSLSGSLVIGYAVARSMADDERLWQASRVDENWQVEQWGEDDAATALAERKRSAFMTASRILNISK